MQYKFDLASLVVYTNNWYYTSYKGFLGDDVRRDLTQSGSMKVKHKLGLLPTLPISPPKII